MKTFFKYIYNAILWLYALVSSTILMVITLIVFVLVYPFDPQRKVMHKMSLFWGLHYLWINPLWKIEYKCAANIDKKKSYVIISNHQSMIDICLVYKIPLIFKWVSKKEVFKMPFIGWLLKLHGDILIDRGDRQSTKKMFKEAESWVQKGCSISIFPEGTRSTDGKIAEFKEGAFMIAKLNKLPILPVVIEGSRDILPVKGAIVGFKATAKLHVLPEISAETVSSMKTKELSDMIHQILLDEHKKMVPERYLNS